MFIISEFIPKVFEMVLYNRLKQKKIEIIVKISIKFFGKGLQNVKTVN